MKITLQLFGGMLTRKTARASGMNGQKEIDEKIANCIICYGISLLDDRVLLSIQPL